MPNKPDHFHLGANFDTRAASAKKRDYTDEEDAIVAGAATPYLNNKIKKLTATVFNQWYTSSCVLHGFYTQLEYEGIVTIKRLMSQLRAYRKRSNYPEPGTAGTDGYEQIKSGQSDLADAPVTSKMREAAANAMERIIGTKLLKDFNYFQIINQTKIPAYVAEGKAVAIFIYATDEEWSQEYVTIRTPLLDPNKADIRHCVCLVPKGDFTEDGKKWLSVHDSSKFGGRHLRYISPEFLAGRVYYASYVTPKDAVVTPPPLPPVVTKPTTPCKFGDRGAAVTNLQAFLVKGGYLEAQYVTGYYGALTCKAVLWFQLANASKIAATIPQLLEWKGEFWGARSINLIK